MYLLGMVLKDVLGVISSGIIWQEALNRALCIWYLYSFKRQDVREFGCLDKKKKKSKLDKIDLPPIPLQFGKDVKDAVKTVFYENPALAIGKLVIKHSKKGKGNFCFHTGSINKALELSDQQKTDVKERIEKNFPCHYDSFKGISYENGYVNIYVEKLIEFKSTSITFKSGMVSK